jgi:hypothetical protein
MLTLKPIFSKKDDYAVLDENRKTIGRIYRAQGVPTGSPAWFWGNNRTPNHPGRDRGFVYSLEAAKAAFKASWEPMPMERSVVEV